MSNEKIQDHVDEQLDRLPRVIAAYVQAQIATTPNVEAHEVARKAVSHHLNFRPDLLGSEHYEHLIDALARKAYAEHHLRQILPALPEHVVLAFNWNQFPAYSTSRRPCVGGARHPDDETPR